MTAQEHAMELHRSFLRITCVSSAVVALAWAASLYFGPYSLILELDGVGHVMATSMTEARCIDAMERMTRATIDGVTVEMGRDAAMYCIAETLSTKEVRHDK